MKFSVFVLLSFLSLTNGFLDEALIMRGGDTIYERETRYYHDGRCKVKFQENGNLIVNDGFGGTDLDDGRMGYSTGRVNSPRCDGETVRYVLGTDGNFSIRCGNNVDFQTNTAVGRRPNWHMSIAWDCRLWIQTGDTDPNDNILFYDEIAWTPIHYMARFYPDDNMNENEWRFVDWSGKRRVLILQGSGNLVLYEEENGILNGNVVWAANMVWGRNGRPDRSKYDQFKMRMARNGDLTLVGMDFDALNGPQEDVYFVYPLGDDARDCFDLEFDDDQDKLVAIPCWTRRNLRGGENAGDLEREKHLHPPRGNNSEE